VIIFQDLPDRTLFLSQFRYNILNKNIQAEDDLYIFNIISNFLEVGVTQVFHRI